MDPPFCQTTFEPWIVWISICSVFLVSLPLRLWSHIYTTQKTITGWLGYSKLSVTVILTVASAVQTIEVCSTAADHLQITSSICLLVAAVGVMWLSFLDHRFSIRPSGLIESYLLGTLACDFIGLLYPGSRQPARILQWMSILDTVLRVVLLLLESHSKRSILLPEYAHISPEETAGVVESFLFGWIWGTLWRGQSCVLRIGDLPLLDTGLEPAYLRGKILRFWELRSKSGDGLILLKVLVRCHMATFSSVAIPRLLLAVCRCSQPILIHEIIIFISKSHTRNDRACGAFWIVVAAVVTYVGMAVSASLYHHRLNRLRVVIRGSLVSLIFHHSLSLESDGLDAGRAVTLMSTDIDGITGAGELFHESWGQLLELAIGFVILAAQVHWVWPVPLILIFFCSRVSRYVAQNVRARQKSWNIATQTRMSALSSALLSMKSIKSLGLCEPVVEYIHRLRQLEISKSKSVRWMSVLYNASANALGIFTPVITVVLVALLARSQNFTFSVAIAFTTVAILAVVTHPANMIMTIVPKIVASLANFERVQEYLTEPQRRDQRADSHNANSTSGQPSISISAAGICAKSKESSATILENINLNIPERSITIFCGLTGSGKSVLAKVLLGEIPSSMGLVTVSSKCIAFCDQTPWLPKGTIKDVVCGFADSIDEPRYADAISACCLEEDISRLPHGHWTEVSNRGVNLSGGQRQRLALARTLYSRCEIAILDDPLTAVDGTTESQIISNLLGKSGWFRRHGTCVLMNTNAAQYFPLADRVLVLDSRGIRSLGSGEVSEQFLSDIRKFTFDSSHTSTVPERDLLLSKEELKVQPDGGEEGDISLYAYYFKSAGVFNCLAVVFCTAFYATFTTISHYWVKQWTEGIHEKSINYIIGYITLAFIAWIATSGTMWSTYILLAPRSGSRLHHSLLKTIFGATLSFTTTTDIGVTLNRFGQDMTLVDRHLPEAFAALCNQIFKMIMQTILLILQERMLVIILPVCTIIVYVVQRAYLRTSRQLRMLELESQSAIYSSFVETTEGILTIRAFNWQSIFESRNTACLGLALRPFYALLSLQQWLNLVLNLMVAAVAIIVIVIALFYSREASGGNIGVALNIILVTNTTLVRLIESWASLEISLGSISRLQGVELYTPQEDEPWECSIPPAVWPSKGEIHITDFRTGYSCDNPVLKSFNLHIPAGRMLILCGRTGSGKSTVLMSLLRLVDGSGMIKIDGQDISRVPRSLLRQRCFITLPQETFLIPDATLRFNLDCASLAPDDVIRIALTRVGIWDHLSKVNIDTADVLYQPLSSLPTLSAGQTQLLGMARALVQRQNSSVSQAVSSQSSYITCKPIFLVDEATAALDLTAEAKMLDVIEEEFVQRGHTVIIVAHRLQALESMIRQGKGMVMHLDNGTVIKEFDMHGSCGLKTVVNEKSDETY